MKSVLVLPVALLLFAAADPPKQIAPTYLETLEVTVSSIDVVVTDKHGAPVPGLRRDDFEVRENGVPQTITNFAEFGTSSGTSELTTTAPAPATATAPPPRKIVFFVDDMSIHPKARGKLANAAHALVEKSMRAGDEALVVTPANATLGTLAFSSDRAAIEKALQNEIDRSVTRTDVGSRAEEFFYQSVVSHAGTPEERRQMARIYATRANRRVTSTLRTLLGIVGSLTETTGKKVLVVISESLVSEPGREAFALGETASLLGNVSPDEFSSRTQFEQGTSNVSWFDARPMIAELGARASANGVTIYAIQPDPGFAISTPGSMASVRSAPRDSNSRLSPIGNVSASFAVTPFQREIAEGTATTLGSLADATGGKYWSGEGGLGDAFNTIAHDIDSYYSIAYRVAGGTKDNIRGIEVAVRNHPDVVVRTRRDVMRYSPDREMDEITTASLLMNRDNNELAITALAEPPKKTHDAYLVDVVVKIPLDKLTFIPVGDGKYRAQISVHYAAADGANYTTGQMRTQALQVPASDIDVVRTKMYSYKSTLVVAPGTAKITVGVLDELSRLSGFQRLSVLAR